MILKKSFSLSDQTDGSDEKTFQPIKKLKRKLILLGNLLQSLHIILLLPLMYFSGWCKKEQNGQKTAKYELVGKNIVELWAALLATFFTTILEKSSPIEDCPVLGFADRVR